MLVVAAGCAGREPAQATSPSDAPSPLGRLSGEELLGDADDDKIDTGFQTSLDAVEVELVMEAELPSGGYWDPQAPLALGQFALTYLRKNEDVYLQSFAEQYAKGREKVEWWVDGAWVTLAADSSLYERRPTRFRVRGMSALVLRASRRGDLEGASFDAVIPANARTLWSDAGNACATEEGGIHADQSVYWYVWDPRKYSCEERFKKTITLRVERVLPAGEPAYPEFDKLLADGEISAVVMWGQVGHDRLDERDWSFSLMRDFEDELTQAGFERQDGAPVGRRYVRTRNGIRALVDVYSAFDFAGLGDYANVQNFYRGVREHEIVVWNGHSMLGASDFWARPQIYEGNGADRYQIFIYNGCLGYEYYVNPILEGKGGWAAVDVVSNALETPFAIMVEETSRALGLVFAGAEQDGRGASWHVILDRMNDIAGLDGIYGASGVRDNAFRPAEVPTS